MKKFKKVILIVLVIFIVTFVIVPTLGWSMFFGTFQLDYLFSPKPPKPEITYAEFPFALEYEIDGVYHKYEDVLVCEFDGFDYGAGLGSDFVRTWKAYFKSGNEQITLFKNAEVEIYTFSVFGPNVVPGRFMGDESISKYDVAAFPYVLHKDKETELYGTAYRFKGNEALMEKYKIRLISWQCAPPITNTFK